MVPIKEVPKNTPILGHAVWAMKRKRDLVKGVNFVATWFAKRALLIFAQISLKLWMWCIIEKNYHADYNIGNIILYRDDQIENQLANKVIFDLLRVQVLLELKKY